MKIINAVLSKQNGGLEQAGLAYANAMRMHGHDVTLLLADRCPFVPEAEATGCAIRFVHNRFGRVDYPAVRKLRRWLKQERPDIIIAHGSRAMELLRRAAGGLAPVVAVNHTTSVKRSVGADAVIVVNAQLKQDVLARGHKDAGTVHVLPNMVTVTPEQKALRVSYAPQTPPVIGVLARFSPEKGLHVLLDALAELRARGIDFRLRLGGDGPQRAELVEYIAGKGLAKQVELCGWVSDRDAFYASLDVYCLPSRTETFGIVVLEAMQRKLPVVATACVGVTELVDGRGDAALLVPPGEAAPLADALERVLADHELAMRLATQGYALVTEKYDIQIVAGQLQKIIAQTVQAYAQRQGDTMKGVDA